MNIQPGKSTILVTGGTGFVGAYVIRDLVRAGYSVRAIRRNTQTPSFIGADIFDKVEWIETDILDLAGLQEAMENTDAVIHSAAKISFHETDRTEMFATNIEGTANIVNIAIEKNIKKLVHVSSVASIGRKKNGSTVNEDTKWEQNKLSTNYSISKYFGEMEVWRGIAEGLNAVIVNPSTVIGYGDWNTSSAALFKNVHNGFPWYTDGINGFVDVEDVSRAIVGLLESDINAERFILNGDNWSYRKLFDAIADGFRKKRPHRKATPLLAKIAWRMESIRSFFTGKRPLITKETAKIGQSDTRFDNTRIINALPGFQFTPLEQTIIRSCGKYI